jgi:hypothetical protein
MQKYPKSEVDNASAVNGPKFPRSQWRKPVITRFDMKRTMGGPGSVADSTGFQQSA